MGKRGPKPKADKPSPGQAGVPSQPSWLNADGKRWWKYITANMQQMGTIGPHHREIIAMVCHQAEIYHACVRDIKKHGYFEYGSMGNRVISPAVKQANTSWDKVTRGLAQLGLTPTSASEVSQVSDDSDDPLGQFIE
jgi:P27 family predicted phage terminase small subunit